MVSAFMGLHLQLSEPWVRDLIEAEVDQEKPDEHDRKEKRGNAPPPPEVLDEGACVDRLVDRAAKRGDPLWAKTEDFEANGGYVTREDLADYEPLVHTPVEGQYRGYTVRSNPPPGSGAILIMGYLAFHATFPFVCGSLALIMFLVSMRLVEPPTEAVAQARQAASVFGTVVLRIGKYLMDLVRGFFLSFL